MGYRECKHGVYVEHPCDECHFENCLKTFTERYIPDEDGYVSFGDVARGELRQQCQYAARYIDGAIDGYPRLGEGLRFKGDSGNYHSLKIHIKDLPHFLDRYNKHKLENSTVNF